ncbi:MAG: hypothetical protein ABIZ80_00720 [Bryobacteraceae bacterium]
MQVLIWVCSWHTYGALLPRRMILIVAETVDDRAAVHRLLSVPPDPELPIREACTVAEALR